MDEKLWSSCSFLSHFLLDCQLPNNDMETSYNCESLTFNLGLFPTSSYNLNQALSVNLVLLFTPFILYVLKI